MFSQLDGLTSAKQFKILVAKQLSKASHQGELVINQLSKYTNSVDKYSNKSIAQEDTDFTVETTTDLVNWGW